MGPIAKKNFETSVKKIDKIREKIKQGTSTFFNESLKYIGVFVGIFIFVLIIVDELNYYTSFAFIIGSLTSIFLGYLSNHVATETNARVTFIVYENIYDRDTAYNQAFQTALKGACVIGYSLVSLAMINLTLLIILYLKLLKPVSLAEFTYIFESLAGYGFGASIVALFNRIGAGIYSKSCDISADLIGRIDNIDQDLATAAVIADNIGDNIGKILGICSDFFCTFCEALCAILIVSGMSPTLTQGANFFWPFLIAASGIVICIISSLIAMSSKVSEKKDVQKTLSDQLDYATTIMTVMVIAIAYYGLPETISFNKLTMGAQGSTIGYTVEKSDILTCVLIGLIAGIGIGYNSYYFTAPENPPCQQLAYYCKNGPAINIIQGFSLGYLSCVTPAIIIACKIVLI